MLKALDSLRRPIGALTWRARTVSRGNLSLSTSFQRATSSAHEWIARVINGLHALKGPTDIADFVFGSQAVVATADMLRQLYPR